MPDRTSMSLLTLALILTSIASSQALDACGIQFRRKLSQVHLWTFSREDLKRLQLQIPSPTKIRTFLHSPFFYSFRNFSFTSQQKFKFLSPKDTLILFEADRLKEVQECASLTLPAAEHRTGLDSSNILLYTAKLS